jgi:hypothetical protein
MAPSRWLSGPLKDVSEESRRRGMKVGWVMALPAVVIAGFCLWSFRMYVEASRIKWGQFQSDRYLFLMYSSILILGGYALGVGFT